MVVVREVTAMAADITTDRAVIELFIDGCQFPERLLWDFNDRVIQPDRGEAHDMD